MRIALFLLVLAAPAAADALKDYRARAKSIKSDLHKYWGEFRGRLMQAVDKSKVDSLKDNTEVADLQGLRDLYAGYTRSMEAWGQADLELAKSGHKRAFPTLWKEFLSVTKEIDGAEDDLADAKAFDAMRFDQEPAVLLCGLYRRLAALRKALASWPELTTTGWTQAVKADGRKSIVRRVAVIDATTDRTFLEARLVDARAELRIAATGRLAPLGYSAVLRTLLIDKEAAVRRAVLQMAMGSGDPKWIGPALQHFAQRKGLEQRLAADLLKALSGQPFGYDEKKWRDWYAEYKKEIDSGRFDRAKIEIQEDKPVPPTPSFEFYGVRSTSLAPVFVVEASRVMLAPAKWAVRRNKATRTWWGEHRTWKDQYESHHAVFQREFAQALDSLPRGAGWGFVLMQGTHNAYPTKRLLGISSRDVGPVMKKIKRMGCRGWCSIERGLEVAAAIDPRVDTVFVVHVGKVSGGRFLTPELMLDWFGRWNRFRRIVVHALRIDNAKKDAEQLMQGLAAASGGVYVWIKEPPK